jgi:hypothetical protein
MRRLFIVLALAGAFAVTSTPAAVAGPDCGDKPGVCPGDSWPYTPGSDSGNILYL